MFKLDVKIDPEIARRIEDLRSEFPADVGEALRNEGARIASEAAARAPRDEGGLAESAFVGQVGGSSSTPEVELGFGAPYALYIEERTDLHHPGGGESKFLSRSVDAAAGGILDRLAEELRPAFEKGTHVTSSSQFPTTASGTSSTRHSSRRSKAARQLGRR